MFTVNNKNIVVDTGPDFRQQMLRENIQNVDAVLFTHAHKDHTAGLDDVRAFNFKHKQDIPIYCESHVLDQLKMEYTYIFDPNILLFSDGGDDIAPLVRKELGIQ